MSPSCSNWTNFRSRLEAGPNPADEASSSICFIVTRPVGMPLFYKFSEGLARRLLLESPMSRPFKRGRVPHWVSPGLILKPRMYPWRRWLGRSIRCRTRTEIVHEATPLLEAIFAVGGSPPGRLIVTHSPDRRVIAATARSAAPIGLSPRLRPFESSPPLHSRRGRMPWRSFE